MRDFRDIKAWQKGHRLALAVYQATKRFPTEERYGLKSQARRAAASIPTNIAEGCGRDSEAEFARFLRIAAGSASELEYLLLLARDLSLFGGLGYRTMRIEGFDLFPQTAHIEALAVLELAPYASMIPCRTA